MKKLFLFSVILSFLISCATKKQSVFTNLDCSKYSVLDSLGYIQYTEDYLRARFLTELIKWEKF